MACSMTLGTGSGSQHWTGGGGHRMGFGMFSSIVDKQVTMGQLMGCN